MLTHALVFLGREKERERERERKGVGRKSRLTKEFYIVFLVQVHLLSHTKFLGAHPKGKCAVYVEGERLTGKV